jgi:hypothetical protein
MALLVAPFGSIGFSHGLFTGSQRATIRTSRGLVFTRSRCLRIHARTAWFVGPEALSKMSRKAVMPGPTERPHHRGRQVAVPALATPIRRFACRRQSGESRFTR